MTSQKMDPYQKEKPPVPTGGFNRALNPSNVQQTIYNNLPNYQAEREERYRKALVALPPPGGGCHAALLGAANYGVLAGLTEADIFTGLRQAIKPGSRKVTDKEIREAIDKAIKESGHQITPQYFNGLTSNERLAQTEAQQAAAILKQDEARKLALREKLIAAGGGGGQGIFDPDLWEASNPHPGAGFEQYTAPTADMLLFLRELYHPDEYLYIGDMFEPRGRNQASHVKTVAEWIKFFTDALNTLLTLDEKNRRFRLQWLAVNYPHFIVNPLKGQPNETGSYRSDTNVETFRYALIEADAKNPQELEQQIPILRALELPIVSLVFSGSKSVHALLNVTQYAGRQITSKAEWDRIIKDELFKLLEPLGFDPLTSNPSRQSRLPGIYRPGGDSWQMLLYINREGGRIK